MPLIESDLIVGVDDLGHDVKFFGATSGRYMEWDESQDRLEFVDNVRTTFGNDADLHIFHDGSNTYIQQQDGKTGNIIIEQQTNDADIIFRCDDGSGGNAEYFRVDGGGELTYFSKAIQMVDNAKIFAGNAGDLVIFHDGTNSALLNETGDLYIQQNADDKDIRFQCDNGSGSLTDYIKLDGSTKRVNVPVQMGINAPTAYTAEGAADDLIIGSGSGEVGMTIYSGSSNHGSIFFAQDLDEEGAGDSPVGARHGKIMYGQDTSDFEFRTGGNQHAATIAHDASSFTGTLQLNNTLTVGVDDTGHDVKFFGATSGRFLLWDESQDRLEFTDDVKVTFGTSADYEIYHNGTASLMSNYTGHLQITNYADDSDIIFQSDDGSGGVAEYLRIDGGEGRVIHTANSRYLDNAVVMIGSSADLQIKHDGSHSYISQGGTGHLYIQQNVDNHDLVFQCDDGSGGTTAYITLDGSAGYTTVQKNMNFADDIKATFGNSNDLKIDHDSSGYGYIQNLTGHLYFVNGADDKDIIFQGDDGAGSTATYFSLDGSAATHDGSATTALYTNWPDKSYISLGTGHDFEMHHNGVDTIIGNQTGDLKIRQFANDKDIIFDCDDGSGGVETYFFLDGSGHNGTFARTVFPDNSLLGFGTGFDSYAYHDGSHFRLQNNTGDLKITCATDDGDIILSSDDGSGGTTAYITLDGSHTKTIMGKTVHFDDNVKIQMGNYANPDLEIYHDGSNSYIDDGGTGSLFVRGSDIFIKTNTSENAIIARSNGAVELYYDNALKLTTASKTVTTEESRFKTSCDPRFTYFSQTSFGGSFFI